MSLRGQVAIVTGSSRGIGRGIAERLLDEGASVVINGRNDRQLAAVSHELEKRGGEVVAVAADVGYAGDVERLFDATLDRFGRVDLLVNNAGLSNTAGIRHFLEMDEQHWDTLIRTNLKSVFLCTRRAAEAMLGPRRGAIVNISSFGATRAHRSMAAYDAAKGGIEAFTRATALDLAPFGIRVNAVGPGAVHVDEHEALGEAAKRRRAEPIPLGRVGSPADIAGAVAFLASADAAYITGQVIYVDGGMLAQLRPPQIDVPIPTSIDRREKT